ncbi:MAG: ATP-binding cassette domain-containing protein, partial [Methanomassiliicoccales archaeon]
MKVDKRLIRSRAPLRISYAGGGTDVSPYCDEHGGAVLSTTIDRYAYCTIKPREDKEVTVRSLDFNRQEHWIADPTMLNYDGNLDLVKAVMKHFDIEQGFDMFLHCDAPPGSGLGSSSTVMVALIGAIAEWQGEPISLYNLAKLAYVLERKELGFAGGRQDQYAAAFGGFNFIEFRGDDVDKPVTVLSGGERARLSIATLIREGVNLLMLDEPTNHMDIHSMEAMEDTILS